MIRKYEVYMGIVVCFFILIVLNSMCFGQTTQTGTRRIMIKGQWVDVPVFTTKGGAKTYYDAHPEERAIDAATQANKPLMDMQQKLIEDIRTWEQGFGGGTYKGNPSPSSSSPSPSPPPIPSGTIDVKRGEVFNDDGESHTKLINPATGHFLTKQGDGYFDYKTSQTWKKTGNGLFNPFTGERMDVTGNGYKDNKTGQTWIKQ